MPGRSLNGVHAERIRENARLYDKHIEIVQKYSFIWKNSTGTAIGQTNDSAINLTSGTYFVTVTDSKNCQTTTNVALIENTPPSITGLTLIDSSFCGLANGSITATVIDGITPYSYVWRDNSGALIGQTNDTATNLHSGIYILQIVQGNKASSSKIVIK